MSSCVLYQVYLINLFYEYDRIMAIKVDLLFRAPAQIELRYVSI